jgi:hypothetical protein
MHTECGKYVCCSSIHSETCCIVLAFYRSNGFTRFYIVLNNDMNIIANQADYYIFGSIIPKIIPLQK